MSNIGYATVSVIPSAKGFGSKLSSQVDPQIKSAGKSSGVSFGKVLGLGALAGVGAAIAGVGAVIHTGFGEAMDASAGTAQLAAGIKSTGNAAGVTVKGLNNLATSIEGMSGQTDDSIVASEKLLLTFTNIKNSGTDKIFDQATLASANMAAKMGGDASASAIQLGKALNDPVKGVGALSRVGVSFTAGQKASIAAMVKAGDTAGAQKIILSELNKEFGGAAKAAGNSLPGQLEKAKRAFEGVSQSVVEGLLPVVLPGLTNIGTTITSKVVPAIGRFVTGFKDGTGAGGRFHSALTVLADIVTGRIIPAFAAMRDAVVGVIKFFKQHQNAAKALGATVAFVLGVVTGAWIAQGVVATINAAKSVIAWLLVATTSTTSASIQKKSTAQIVVGWIVAGVKAMAGAAVQVAAWLIAKVSAIGTMALYGVAFAFMAAEWVAAGVKAMAGAVRIAAAWVLSKIQVAGTILLYGIAFGIMAAGWIASGVAAMAGAVVMAAAWLIALGPIGIVIALVVALVVAIILNWDRIKAATVRVWNAIKSGVVNAVRAVVSFVKSHWKLLLAIITGPIGAAVIFVISHWGQIKSATSAAFNFVKSIVKSAVGGVKSSVSSAIGNVVSIFRGLLGKIKGALSGAGSALSGIGRNIVQGLIGGIKSMGGAISSALVGLLPGPLKKFAGKLGIASPSKVFHAFGLNIGQGLVLGVDKSRGNVEDSMSRLVSSVTMPSGARFDASVTPTASRSSGGGRTHFTMTNWQEGTGYFETVADGRINDNASLMATTGRQSKW